MKSISRNFTHTNSQSLARIYLSKQNKVGRNRKQKGGRKMVVFILGIFVPFELGDSS
jgi:hypothetical protein